MDLYFQGMAWLNKGVSVENMARAHSFFDRALSVNPDNVDALIGSARVDALGAANSDPAAAFAAAEIKVDQILVLGPGPCTCAFIFGTCPHLDQARDRGHRRM